MLADDPQMDPRTRFSLSVVLAGLEMDQGLPARVEARARKALAHDGASAEPMARLRLQRLLAAALAQQERVAEAVEVLEGAMAGLQAPASAVEANARALLQAQLGSQYAASGRLDEATAQFDAAFDVLVSSETPMDGESLQALDRLARNLDFGQRGEDLEKVNAVLRRLSVAPAGESAMHKALRLQALGYVEGLAGRPIEGAERSREAAGVLAEALGPTHPQVAKAMGAACTNFINGGGIVQARETCARAVEMEVEGGRGDGARARNIRVNVSIVDLIRGDFVSAAALMEQVLEGVERESDPQLHMFGEGVLARVDLRQGRYRESLARLNMLWTMAQRDFAENEDLKAEIGGTRAEVLIELGRLGEARRALDESEMTAETGGLRDRVLPGRLTTRGNLAAAQGQREEAVDLVEQGLRGFEAHSAVSPLEMGWALLDSGEALLRAEAMPRAKEIYERALGTGLEPDRHPALWAWAVLRLEQLDPGRYEQDTLERAVQIARHQFGPSGGQATPCLRLPPALGGDPEPELRVRTTCL